MFGQIAAFELRYQLRQPVFWVAAAFFFLIVFGSMTVDNIQVGGGGGGVHKNAPTAIAMTHLVMSIFFIFVTAALVANVIVRDDETGFGPLVRSTRITRLDYLLGRFSGAFAAAALVFLAVPLGMFLGSLAPWVDPETLGPNRLGDYLYAYGALALPSVFLTAALFFALATATRSMMATYIGATALLILWVVMGTLATRNEMRELAAWLDPFGGIALGREIRYYTTFDANTRLPALAGVLLANRLLWTSVGLVALAAACLTFRFETRRAGQGPARRSERETPPPPRTLDGPQASPRSGPAVAILQALHRARFEAAQVLLSPAFGILLVLGLFNASGGIFLGIEQNGSVFLPTTLRMIEQLQGAFSFVVILVAIYYAGELVWRDRERRIADIVDSTSAPDWTFMVPKVLGLVLVLGAMLLVSALAAAAAQAILGFPHPEWGQYLGWYILPTLADWALLAVLAVFLQAIAPNKFVGWALMAVYLILQLGLSTAGFEHNLYNYAGGPRVPLSDMNGQGDYAGFAAWFRAYWTAFAILLLVLTQGLWARGARDGVRARLARLGRRLRGPTGIAAAACLLVFAALGGFIFLNTNVWNPYRTQKEGETWQADLEKGFLKYERLPQPSVTDVTLDLDLDPHAPRLSVKGAYDLVNDTGAPVSQLHVRFDRDVKVDRLVLSRPARTEAFDRFNYRILHLDRPLAPGETARLEFATTLSQKGFRNSGNTTRLVDNGTFVSNDEFAPILGMSRSGLLQDRTKRRKYGLPPELRPAKLEDESARARNYVGNADWVRSDITVSTVADQVPVAPGYVVSDVTAGGRRTVRFRTDAPVLNFFSVQSARYAIRRETYKGVDLAVYHHPGHPWNVERMMASMKRSLDYYQANFSPYQFRQARILEFPGYATFAQAFANTIPYSEAIGFTADPDKPDKIDFATYVTAHEMAHQWWAHQIIGADMQGATVLSETLAQYSALLIMEQTYGPEGIRKFLRNELDSYLAARGGQAVEETPLIRVENQPYIHYRKGSLVMYLLRDQIGEAKVNAALRSLLARYAFKGAPYPTARDLVDALRREAGDDARAQALITDLFEKITLYDLKSEEASARRRPDGRYDVTLKIAARKLYADGKGAETRAPLGSETFDVGVFTAEPGKPGFTRASVQSFTVQALKDGEQSLTVTVDGKPAFAGIDPYNKRIDRNSGDNVVRVKVEG